MDSYLKKRQWRDPVEPYLQAQGSELNGKTLGVLGLGRIGRRVAHLVDAFSMKVIAYDPFLSTRATTPESPPADNRFATNVQMVSSLPSLLSQSDYISIHVPNTPSTECLIDGQLMASVRPGCRLINTSSYRAVEESALVEALQREQLAGAALDVFASHPIAPNSPLLKLDNVILTPHVGGATEETIVRHSQTIVEDIRRFLHGQPLQHLVNPQVLSHLA